MARTIQQIKEDIAATFMMNAVAAEKYGFEKGSDFYRTFSKASTFSMLFYIFAAASWLVESLFDQYKAEVDARIEEIIPHRPKWYRDKVLAFMKGKELVQDADYYDTSDMSDADIEAARVVKHVVAVERSDTSILTIKVRGVNGRLDDETEGQLKRYIDEIRDAGIKYNLVNTDPDTFNCEVDVYYNPLLLPEMIQEACVLAITDYINNLPFNGQYTNMEMIDRLQVIEGVRIVEFVSASSHPATAQVAIPINGFCIPEAGYFVPKTITVNMKIYE